MLIKILKRLYSVFLGPLSQLEDKVNKSLHRGKTTKTIRQQCLIVNLVAVVVTGASILLFFYVDDGYWLIGFCLAFSMFVVGIYGLITGKILLS